MAEPISAALITAGSALAGTGSNIAFNAAANKKQRKWSEQMYQRQYEDNVKFWEQQNAYNSPQAQMQRFQEAGLNPNLIYGQGTSGNAGSISTPDVQPVQYKTPDVSGIGYAGEALGTGLLQRTQDFEIRQAQIDGMQLDNEYKGIRNITAGFQQQSAGLDFNRKTYDMEQGLWATQADALRADLRQKIANTNFTINEDIRKQAMQAPNLQQALIAVAQANLNLAKTQDERDQIRQVIKNLKVDESIKLREDKMRAMGWTPGSPAWMGVITQMLNLAMGGN